MLTFQLVFNVLLMTASTLNCVPSKGIRTTLHELWYGKKLSLDHFAHGFSWLCVYPPHKNGKIGPKASKMVSLIYLRHFKGYVMYREHLNDGMMEIIHKVNFLDNEFPSIDGIKKDLELYKLQEDL